MLNKDHVYGCASTLTLVVLLLVAVPGHVAAQTHSPGAGQFEQVFGNRGRTDPTFMRPDTARQMPPLPAQSDQNDLQSQGVSESPQNKGVLVQLQRTCWWSGSRGSHRKC